MGSRLAITSVFVMLLSAIAFATQMWGSLPVNAQGEITFTLMSVTDESVTVDLAQLGTSQGDMIVTHATLYGAQFGEVRGRHDFVSVITDPLDQPDETVQ